MCVRSLRDLRDWGEPAARAGRGVVVRPVLAHARREPTLRASESPQIQRTPEIRPLSCPLGARHGTLTDSCSTWRVGSALLRGARPAALTRRHWLGWWSAV